MEILELIMESNENFSKDVTNFQTSSTNFILIDSNPTVKLSLHEILWNYWKIEILMKMDSLITLN